MQPPNASTGGTGNAQGGDGGTFRATCTAECSSDGDCSAETTMYCKEGFKCAVATQAGPFCCKKLCICKSDLVEGVNVDADGGTVVPFSCDPKQNPTPTCPNVTK